MSSESDYWVVDGQTVNNNGSVAYCWPDIREGGGESDRAMLPSVGTADTIRDERCLLVLSAETPNTF